MTSMSDAGADVPGTAIILVNWNGWRDTVACIETCLALEGAPFRIIVCDNASASSGPRCYAPAYSSA